MSTTYWTLACRKDMPSHRGWRWVSGGILSQDTNNNKFENSRRIKRENFGESNKKWRSAMFPLKKWDAVMSKAKENNEEFKLDWICELWDSSDSWGALKWLTWTETNGRNSFEDECEDGWWMSEPKDWSGGVVKEDMSREERMEKERK